MKTNKILSDDELVLRWDELTRTTHKANLDEITLIVSSTWWKAFRKEMRKLIGFPLKGYKPDSQDLNHLSWSSNNRYWEAWWKDRSAMDLFYQSLKRLMIDKEIREDFKDYLELNICYSVIFAPPTDISVINTYEGYDPKTNFISDRWLPPQIELHNGAISTGDKLISDYWVKKSLEENKRPSNKVKRGLKNMKKYLKVQEFLETNKKEKVYDPVTDTFDTFGTMESLSLEVHGQTTEKNKKRLINNTSQLKRRLQKYKR